MTQQYNADFATAMSAVEAGTLFADLSPAVSNTVASLVQLKTLCDSHGINTSVLQASITSLSAIDLTAAVDYQMTNMENNLEIYNSYIAMQVSIGEIAQYDTTHDLHTYFGSVLLPNEIKSIADKRIERMAGSYPEILPSDAIWMADLNLDFSTIQSGVAKLASLNEEQSFTNAIGRLSSYTSAVQFVSYLDNPVGLTILDAVSAGNFKTVVNNKKAAINSLFGFTTAASTDPVSDTDTPYYDPTEQDPLP